MPIQGRQVAAQATDSRTGVEILARELEGVM